MHSSRRGDISELKAIAWLLEQGYEVFWNACCTGDTDMVAWKDHEGPPIKINVKTLTPKIQGDSRRDVFAFRTEQ